MQSLWLAETADDVRMAVMACLADDAEVEPIKLKAIAFLAAVVKKGGTEAIGRVWAEELARCSRVKGSRPPRYTFVVPACADSTEASAARVRHAALKLLCAMCAQREPPKPDEQTDEAAEGAKEGASGAALRDEVMRVLLAAFEGERAVLDRQMREEIETEYERLEMARAAIGGEATSSQPLRLRSRYADLAVHERLARLRRVWERRGRGKGKMRVKVTIGSLVEDMLVLGQRLGDREDIDEMNPMHIRFDLDHGSDAGGLTRHCFAEFGKGLPLIEMVGATTEALTEMRDLLRKWKPPLSSASGREEALMNQVRAILRQHDAAAAHAGGPAAGSGGTSGEEGGSGSSVGTPSYSPRSPSSPATEMGPPAPKRPRHLPPKTPPKLFKLTESGSLAPTGAETLCGRVGEATDEGGAIVPEINEATLSRYRVIGRVCALALVNNATLGLPFARYFLRLVLREPPKTLADLQAEEEEERNSNFGLSDCLKSSLAEQGMEGMMTFRRQASIFEVPLKRAPSIEVTDDNKVDFLRRNLEHQLVRTIEKQAAAFREGVEEITGVGWLQLLSAGELKEVWGGHAIDDARLAMWREHTETPADVLTSELWWKWLATCTESKRAQVLQFATGSARLPSDSELTRWKFVIEGLDDYQSIAPTESNGLTAPAMLARASTCSNTIYLPPYADVDALEIGMNYSLMDGGFGLA